MPDVDVPGSDNVVIVAGRDVYLSTSPAAPPTGDDRRNLENLLGHVRRIWITGVLERSVGHAALVDPPAQMQPAAVEPAWRRYVEPSGPGHDASASSGSIGQVFDDAGRMLLVLGDPGAGKSITLLTLARACIERAEADPAAPVPVVLNLSSWTAAGAFHDWLVVELSRAYGVGRTLARRWVADHRLILLLDGLDEVGEDRRAGCVRALHAFVQEHGVPGLAVCCRSAEYGALPLRLELGGAVLLLPLEPAQVNAYLDAAGPALDGLRDALGRNAELGALATSPLMLSIMTLAFRGVDAGALAFDERSTREELRDEIFSRFVDRMFALRERPDPPFSRARMEDGLRWLASGMMERGRTFAVELLQPVWLTPRQRLLYALGSRVGGAIVTTVSIGVLVCLCGLVLARFGSTTTRQALTSIGGMSTVSATLGAAVAMALLVGLFYAPLGYRHLRLSHKDGAREPGMTEELGLFTGYLGLSGLAAFLVCEIGTWAFGFSLRAPGTLAAYVTVVTSAISLPMIFGRKAGRGSSGGDISLAGILAWRWRTTFELATACSLATAVLLPFAPRFGVTHTSALTVNAITMFTLVMYGSWRQEVPPVDRWKGGEGNSALSNSVRAFGYAGLACILVLFPTMAFSLGPESLRDAFSLSVTLAVLLFSPALFWFGGIDLVLHGVLRLVLAGTGTMPLRLHRFLDHAVHLGFLQRVGGGYTFFHGLLMEHFAHASPSGSTPSRPAHPALLHLSISPVDAMPNMSNVHVSGDGNTVLSGGRDLNVTLPASPQPAGTGAAAPVTPAQEHILFLAANSTRRPLDLELELRRIEEHLLQASRRDRFVLTAVPAVTVDALLRTMMEQAPTHVHFSGHGRSDGIMLRDERGDPRLVSSGALESLFELCGGPVRCVVLNACYSEPQARAIRKHVPHVVGSTDRISDAAGLSFSSGFYLALASGKDVPFAFQAGKLRMRMDNVPGEELLVLL